jgi:hypothetical protein
MDEEGCRASGVEKTPACTGMGEDPSAYWLTESPFKLSMGDPMPETGPVMAAVEDSSPPAGAAPASAPGSCEANPSGVDACLWYELPNARGVVILASSCAVCCGGTESWSLRGDWEAGEGDYGAGACVLE